MRCGIPRRGTRIPLNEGMGRALGRVTRTFREAPAAAVPGPPRVRCRAARRPPERCGRSRPRRAPSSAAAWPARGCGGSRRRASSIPGACRPWPGPRRSSRRWATGVFELAGLALTRARCGAGAGGGSRPPAHRLPPDRRLRAAQPERRRRGRGPDGERPGRPRRTPAGREVSVTLSVAFGCPFDGRGRSRPRGRARCAHGRRRCGGALPGGHDRRRRCRRRCGICCRGWSTRWARPVGLHLHDTRGTALACLVCRSRMRRDGHRRVGGRTRRLPVRAGRDGQRRDRGRRLPARAQRHRDGDRPRRPDRGGAVAGRRTGPRPAGAGAARRAVPAGRREPSCAAAECSRREWPGRRRGRGARGSRRPPTGSGMPWRSRSSRKAALAGEGLEHLLARAGVEHARCRRRPAGRRAGACWPRRARRSSRRSAPAGRRDRRENFQIDACIASGPRGGRLGTSTRRRNSHTVSSRWFQPTVSTVTMPRSGLHCDSRLSSTVVSRIDRVAVEGRAFLCCSDSTSRFAIALPETSGHAHAEHQRVDEVADHDVLAELRLASPRSAHRCAAGGGSS